METSTINTKKLIEESDKTYNSKSEKNFCELCWVDPDKKDSLIIKNTQPFKDVMAARAKGTTPYELIDLYGSPEGVAGAFPEKAGAQYGDYSDMPEMFNQEAVDRIQAKMQAQIEAAIQEELEKTKQKDPAPNPENGKNGGDK